MTKIAIALVHVTGTFAFDIQCSVMSGLQIRAMRKRWRTETLYLGKQKRPLTPKLVSQSLHLKSKIACLAHFVSVFFLSPGLGTRLDDMLCIAIKCHYKYYTLTKLLLLLLVYKAAYIIRL